MQALLTVSRRTAVSVDTMIALREWRRKTPVCAVWDGDGDGGVWVMVLVMVMCGVCVCVVLGQAEGGRGGARWVSEAGGRGRGGWAGPVVGGVRSVGWGRVGEGAVMILGIKKKSASITPLTHTPSLYMPVHL